MILRRSSWKYVRSFCTNVTNCQSESQINMEQLETATFKLTDLRRSALNMLYYDSAKSCEWKATESLPHHKATIVATHGTPGSHKDFKYMVPNLVALGYRVVIPNWPGFGFTHHPLHEFRHSNKDRAKLLGDFLKAINVHKVDVMVGHSAGCYPLPLLFNDNPDLCSAAVFIAPGGASPHRSFRPYWLTKVVASMLDWSFIKTALSRFIAFFITSVFGMRIKHHSEAVAITQVAANIDFTLLNKALKLLKEIRKPPIILMIGGDDQLVEKVKSVEYAHMLGCQDDQHIYSVKRENGRIEEIIKRMIKDEAELHRHHALIFEGGGHFLQKDEADAICKVISAIVSSSSSNDDN